MHKNVDNPCLDIAKRKILLSASARYVNDKNYKFTIITYHYSLTILFIIL